MSVIMGIPVMTRRINTPRPRFSVHFGRRVKQLADGARTTVDGLDWRFGGGHAVASLMTVTRTRPVSGLSRRYRGLLHRWHRVRLSELMSG